ncbi:MAG: hypothetical protein DRR08_13820 [Candidatus Parabeggiatoa sp. nov. 2]|nr:MAG: hypothetical protein DRR08_13820 [Gammaproteobacteria bacterium]
MLKRFFCHSNLKRRESIKTPFAADGQSAAIRLINANRLEVQLLLGINGFLVWTLVAKLKFGLPLIDKSYQYLNQF